MLFSKAWKSQVCCAAGLPSLLLQLEAVLYARETLIRLALTGSGPSISEGSLASSQQDKLWVVDTLPTQWTVPVQTAAGPGRMLEKRSTCELEADACVEHVLNRADVSLPAFC